MSGSNLIVPIYGSPLGSGGAYGAGFCLSNGTTTGSKKPATLSPLDCEMLRKIMRSLVPVIQMTSTIIEQFFPGITAWATVVAPMSARMFVSEAVLTRMLWAKKFPGVKYDATNMLNLLQLKGIYLDLGMDWRQDPVLVKVDWNSV